MKNFIPIFLLLAVFSSAAFAQTDTVILVSDITHVDMLIAKAAGEKEGIPVLVLTDGMLSAEVKAELANMSVRTVILVGGPVVIKPEVQTELEASGYNVIRLWGTERTGTALEVASYFWKGGSRCVVLADDTKNSGTDAETQAEAADDAIINGCPFIPVPRGEIPTEVLDIIHELNAQEARFVGRIASAEFRLKLARLRLVEILGNKDEVEDELAEEAEETANNASQKLKLVIIAAPHWKNLLGFAGHESRHAIVKRVSNTSSVSGLIELINSKNITEIFVVGHPALAQEIAGQLEAAGIDVKKISGEKASDVAKETLRETLKRWEERKRQAAGNDTLIRTQIRQHLLALLNRTELKLALLETELASLNTSNVNQSIVQEIQEKIDNAQGQISAIKDYIQNGNFDTARTRIVELLHDVNYLRWLHRIELKIDQLKEIEEEEDDIDDTENESDFSGLEGKLERLKARCNAEIIERLIERAKDIREDIQQAKSEGDYTGVAGLLVEMRDVVKQARHLSDVCERMSRIATSLEMIAEKRAMTANRTAATAKTVEITSTGFSPNTVTIIRDGTVTWINKDTAGHWPASAIHPTHAVYPGSGTEKCGTDKADEIFDACKGLSQEESFTFKFDERGTWQYHDHLNPTLFGAVTVV